MWDLHTVDTAGPLPEEVLCFLHPVHLCHVLFPPGVQVCQQGHKVRMRGACQEGVAQTEAGGLT